MIDFDPPAEIVQVVTCPGCKKRHLPAGAFGGILNCTCGEWRWYFGWSEVGA